MLLPVESSAAGVTRPLSSMKILSVIFAFTVAFPSQQALMRETIIVKKLGCKMVSNDSVDGLN